ncbi:hypothetical protein AB0B94_31470 [Micromonospora sp. NPDC048986]|uniref:hypothetical protein n=1 Tax=Micromonospora sp. NPDC048986 TaxID=3155644 RepID=UPI0033F351B7
MRRAAGGGRRAAGLDPDPDLGLDLDLDLDLDLGWPGPDLDLGWPGPDLDLGWPGLGLDLGLDLDWPGVLGRARGGGSAGGASDGPVRVAECWGE